MMRKSSLQLRLNQRYKSKQRPHPPDGGCDFLLYRDFRFIREDVCCCLRTGKYDGTNRAYFFPRVENRLTRRRKNGRS